MSFGNVYCVHVQNKVIPKSASEKQPVYKTFRVTSVLFARLWFNVQLENISLIDTRIFLSDGDAVIDGEGLQTEGPMAFLHGEITQTVPHLL